MVCYFRLVGLLGCSVFGSAFFLTFLPGGLVSLGLGVGLWAFLASFPLPFCFPLGCVWLFGPGPLVLFILKNICRRKNSSSNLASRKIDILSKGVNLLTHNFNHRSLRCFARNLVKSILKRTLSTTTRASSIGHIGDERGGESKGGKSVLLKVENLFLM